MTIMNRRIHTWIILLLCSFLFVKAHAENPIIQQFDFRVKADGAAAVEVKMKMNAMQWSLYKQNTGRLGLAVRKREMERIMPAYLLEDFTYKEDELQRTAFYSFSLIGICEYMGSNKWKIRLDLKDPQVEKLDKNIFMLTNLLSPEEGNLQQIQKVYLPETATDAELSKDALGFAEIRFKQKTEGSRIFSLMGLGDLLVLGGTGWFILGKKKMTGPKT